MYKFYVFGIGLGPQERGIYCHMMDRENVYSSLTEITGPSLPIFIPSSFKCIIHTLKDISSVFPNIKIILPLGEMRETSPVFWNLKKKKKKGWEIPRVEQRCLWTSMYLPEYLKLNYLGFINRILFSYQIYDVHVHKVKTKSNTTS